MFQQKPRQGARNVIDTRWVYKFKWEHPEQTAHGGGGRLTETSGVQKMTDHSAHKSGGRLIEAPAVRRTIRARLTVRGFKDSERGDIDR